MLQVLPPIHKLRRSIQRFHKQASPLTQQQQLNKQFADHWERQLNKFVKDLNISDSSNGSIPAVGAEKYLDDQDENPLALSGLHKLDASPHTVIKKLPDSAQNLSLLLNSIDQRAAKSGMANWKSSSTLRSFSPMTDTSTAHCLQPQTLEQLVKDLEPLDKKNSPRLSKEDHDTQTQRKLRRELRQTRNTPPRKPKYLADCGERSPKPAVEHVLALLKPTGRSQSHFPFDPVDENIGGQNASNAGKLYYRQVSSEEEALGLTVHRSPATVGFEAARDRRQSLFALQQLRLANQRRLESEITVFGVIVTDRNAHGLLADAVLDNRKELLVKLRITLKQIIASVTRNVIGDNDFHNIRKFQLLSLLTNIVRDRCRDLYQVNHSCNACLCRSNQLNDREATLLEQIQDSACYTFVVYTYAIEKREQGMIVSTQMLRDPTQDTLITHNYEKENFVVIVVVYLIRKYVFFSNGARKFLNYPNLNTLYKYGQIFSTAPLKLFLNNIVEMTFVNDDVNLRFQSRLNGIFSIFYVVVLELLCISLRASFLTPSRTVVLQLCKSCPYESEANTRRLLSVTHVMSFEIPYLKKAAHPNRYEQGVRNPDDRFLVADGLNPLLFLVYRVGVPVSTYVKAKAVLVTFDNIHYKSSGAFAPVPTSTKERLVELTCEECGKCCKSKAGLVTHHRVHDDKNVGHFHTPGKLYRRQLAHRMPVKRKQIHRANYAAIQTLYHQKRKDAALLCSMSHGRIYTKETAGKGVCNPQQNLFKLLDEMMGAPLKPHQRMEITMNYLLPRLTYSFVLGQIHRNTLKRLDYYIAESAFGKAPFYPVPCTTQCGQRFRIWQDCSGSQPPIQVHGAFVNTKELAAAWGDGPHKSVDGRGLRGLVASPLSNRWLVFPERVFPRIFIRGIQLRCNLLRTRVRSTRHGHGGQTIFCRGNCGQPKSLVHILQSCWITHDARCARHNQVAMGLAKPFCCLGYTVFEKLRAPTSRSFIKPDCLERRATVIDVSIVSDGRGVTVRNEKKEKHGVDEYSLAIISTLRAIGCDVDFLVHQPMTIAYRGIGFPQSAKTVIGLGRPKVTVTVTAIVSSLRTYDTFMRGAWH
ncbi:retrovirus-related Pol polyprotein from type-1 retrotransposable element R2 [Clonorchis sinensis]|uniref:Retrovirus-related Pol polyprotein from type-1 retrotransposable element R2 n=1 Tax=Clonorchis sinensis TaxID=79923 RepID=G7YQA2_CLOSI|nr:retrovirus-related Pol polyprotein from type-1 retrotransposable element R2 [Clonorchis sinensis]